MNKNTTVQVGADARVTDAWTVGGAFSYTDGSVTAADLSGDNKAYAFTAYGVWQSEDGVYADHTARYARMEADFIAETMMGSYDNDAWSLSAEVGRRIPVTGHLFMELQAEVIWGRVYGANFTGSNGTRFEQADYDSLTTRFGARAGLTLPKKKGDLYARFSVVHDFEGEVETTATNGSSCTIKDDLGGTWIEYGVGGNYRVNDTTNFYVDLERTSGGEVKENWRWTVGVRKVF